MGDPATEHDGRQARGNAESRAQVVSALAAVIRWVGLAFAAVLVVHVVLTVGGANPDNGITVFFRSFADALVIGFRDLFRVDDDKGRVLVNYGIAALFWLVVSGIVVRIIRRLG